MTEIPNPWILPSRFILDEQLFMAALGDPPPIFLTAPSEEYLSAVELMPIVEILTAHR